MRLFKRGKIWWVELSRGVARSLKTTDRTEAETIVREMTIEDLKGRVVDLKGMKRVLISEFVDIYLGGRLSRSELTQKADRQTWGQVILCLGDILMTDITSAGIDKFVAWCTKRGAKPISINHYLRHIRAGLRWALKRKYILEMPEIEMLTYDQRGVTVLEPADIQRILQAAKEKRGYEFYALIAFYLYTGARRTEALSCAVVLDGDYPHVVMTKTKGRRDRTVPLSPHLIEILRPLVDNTRIRFEDVHPDTISHWFKEIAVDLGLDVHLHDLRHNAATYMIKSGMHVAAVRDILGHADIKTTMIYTHVHDKFKQAEMGKLRY